MHLQLGDLSYVIVSSPEFASLVTKNHDLSFYSRLQHLFTQILFYGAKAAAEEGEPTGSSRRSKNRGSHIGSLGCALPRNTRRLRRRIEVDYREERDLIEELGKPRRRMNRHHEEEKEESERRI
ncbi:Cytochrome P450 71D11 (Fragment) [Linum perenne]